jgi:hypothetical protein
MSGKIFAHVEGGPAEGLACTYPGVKSSRGSSVRRPWSKDPHHCEWKFFFIRRKSNVFSCWNSSSNVKIRLNTENQLPRLPASASGVFYSEYCCMWPPIAKMPKTFFTNSPVIPYVKTEDKLGWAGPHSRFTLSFPLISPLEFISLDLYSGY